MNRRPPIVTRTDTRVPYTTRFRARVGLSPAGETWQDGEIGGKGGVGKNRDTPGRDGPTGCRCDLRAGSMERRRNPGATRRGRQGSPVTSCARPPLPFFPPAGVRPVLLVRDRKSGG